MNKNIIKPSKIEKNSSINIHSVGLRNNQLHPDIK